MMTTKPKKNEQAKSQREKDRLIALEEFKDELKARSRDKRAIETEKRQRAARSAIVDANRKKPTVREKVETVKEDPGLDISDLTYEQIEALKEYGGLTGNVTREQVDEIISRVSPLTEDGTPFVIVTPRPKKRFLSPRRLTIKDITTGIEIVL
jgi:hypothetical protein